MAEADHDGSSPTEDRPAERIDDEFIPDDALPLCAKCLKPCNPLQYYCDNCASNDAINPLTPYIPFVNIPFNYSVYCTMWRRIWNGNETSIIGRFFYLFLIILCAPIVAVIGVGEILTRKIPQGRLRNAILTILILALIALLVWYACLARR
ncbi:MAG TPA: hypothetical protein VJJ98_06065 [Sedimentisphaerales bacterium]|nr:hypothetical protein [Sedimentisphaerales bacterium]